MKQVALAALVVALTLFTGGAINAFAQSDDVFMLEEITVTAEKRAVNVQKLPMSVVALDGNNLVQQGKVTTTQILEGVPNVVVATFDETSDDENPNGNITIRGVKRTQETGGGSAPASTATYVDGVYQGIGGNYDINRVEVLRGPQGTLYGRSATGGVVAFYTNDPKLSEFGGSASLEVGEANLINSQAAVNVPLGDKFAIRVAGHYYEKDGYHNPDGDYVKITQGRVKALYQPSEALDILMSLSATRKEDGSGGNTAMLTSATDIDYNASVEDVVMSDPNDYLQAFLNVNYDFDEASLTYIGAVHTYDATGMKGIRTTNTCVQKAYWDFPTDLHHSQEIRLASDSDGPFTWLIGGNYYSQDYEKTATTIQLKSFDFDGNLETDPNTLDVDMYSSTLILDVQNFGLFTEETFEIRDDMRITAGLRYDKTDIVQSTIYDFNVNLNQYLNSLNPAEIVRYSIIDEKNDYSNVTYKLRFEYDLTQDNMLYALTATGVLPGITQVYPMVNMDWGTGTMNGVDFTLLPFEEMELTSYEIGSKNRFLNNTLELNVAAYFYDFEGYQEAVNVSSGGPPQYIVLAVPVEMVGFELDATWQISYSDKVWLTAGWVKAEIQSWPEIEGVGSSKQYGALDKLPGVPELTASIGYDHTFYLGNGSSLVPRVELRYTDGHYLQQLTEAQVELGSLPYNYQDDYFICDIGATWTSPSGMYAITGYVRNLFDEEYKTDVSLSTRSLSNTTVEVGDPQTWGLMVSAKF